MSENYDRAAKEFLELASHQRLAILFGMLQEPTKISTISKQLDATIQEVSRNFGRLSKTGLITKDSDGRYHLSAFGKAVCTQIPSIVFLSQNKKYFEKHDFGGLPSKFIQRVGALEESKYIKGFVKVQEKLEEIHQNANQYVHSIITEEPTELIELAIKKAKQGVLLQNILSESTILSKERKNILEKNGYRSLIQKGQIQRKMKKDINVLVVLNEKEGCVIFPTVEGESDMSQMIYGNSPKFHEWCLDYFRYVWHISDDYIESKLKE